MADTTIACEICFKKINKEEPLHLLGHDSMLYPKLSTLHIKAEMSIDENPLACNDCKFKIDEEYQGLMQSDNVLLNVNLPHSFSTNHSSLVNEDNNLTKIKEEFVKVVIKNENEDIVKEECVSRNTDVSTCEEDLTTSDITYYCYKCNYATSDKQILTNHIFIHPFTCNLCSYTTFDNSSLQRHEKVHFNVTSEENVVECHDSSYQCKSRTTSEFHVLTHKKLLNCGCIRNKSKNSRRHLCKNFEERLFTCDMCDYKCYNKTNLIQHNKTHSQKKQFKCNICDYRTNRSGHLKNHMYKHSGEKPFGCDKCDYRSCQKSCLTRHNRTHTQEKPFKCNICVYRSNRAEHLKTHMYKHSGEKPFRCDKCDYRCCYKSALTEHIRIHSQEKPFKCNVCDYCTNRSRDLKSHMYSHRQ